MAGVSNFGMLFPNFSAPSRVPMRRGPAPAPVPATAPVANPYAGMTAAQFAALATPHTVAQQQNAVMQTTGMPIANPNVQSEIIPTNQEVWRMAGFGGNRTGQQPTQGGSGQNNNSSQPGAIGGTAAQNADGTWSYTNPDGTVYSGLSFNPTTADVRGGMLRSLSKDGNGVYSPEQRVEQINAAYAAQQNAGAAAQSSMSGYNATGQLPADLMFENYDINGKPLGTYFGAGSSPANMNQGYANLGSGVGGTITPTMAGDINRDRSAAMLNQQNAYNTMNGQGYYGGMIEQNYGQPFNGAYAGPGGDQTGSPQAPAPTPAPAQMPGQQPSSGPGSPFPTFMNLGMSGGFGAQPTTGTNQGWGGAFGQPQPKSNGWSGGWGS